MVSIVWYNCQACGKLVKRRHRADRNLLCLECSIRKDILTVRTQVLAAALRRLDRKRSET